MRTVSSLLLTILVAGCATYSSSPLKDDPAVLAAPLASILEARAGAIDRPWLKPTSIDLSAPLTPEGVAVLAVVNNPDLAALRARSGVADAQVFAAGLLPDPTFSLGADNVLSGPDTMLGIASSLGFNLNALRTRGVTRQQARAEARKVRLDLAWSEWQTAGQARLQAARIGALERQVALDRASRESAQVMLDHMLRAAGRGDIAGDQVQGARVAAFDAAERLRNDEKELSAARLELARMIGFPPDQVLLLAPPFLPPPPPPDAAILFAMAQKGRTDLQALRAGYAAQEAALHKAVLDQFPTLDLTVNTARDTAGNVTVGPAVAFTLPLWNRNRGGIAVERATRAALKAEYDARLFQTRAEISAALAGVTLSRRQRDAVLASLPAARRFAAANRRAADRGDLSLATAATAEQALRDKELQLAQAERDIAEQTIALELLIGTPQETWTP
ncbi:TolC family protein [Sphingobium sp.]|uniref:TolC family protein n=1 Tax=Sphingobium sp. TaxID=1912891 RepID=UPI0028BD5F1A|nr:TolC family protein [Sphingobium sp.]